MNAEIFPTALRGACLASVSALGLLAAPNARAAAPQTGAVQTIVVSAPRSTRKIDAITAATMAQAPPGTSPIKVLAQLPGVNYTSADNFGAYEWATRISSRGFGQSQLGYTLDGIPLGDMSYGNYNGLHISRALIDEDLARADLSQGTGALSAASTSNLGGTLQFYSVDPTDRFGVDAAQSAGSDAMVRSFGRVNSGLLASGLKLYVAGAHQQSEKWRGNGQQRYDQANLKFIQSLPGDDSITGYFDYSYRAEVDYQDDSFEMIRKLGYDWDNYGHWGEAVAAAQGSFSHGEQNIAVSAYNDPEDAAYYGGSGVRKDYLGGLTAKVNLAGDVRWKTLVYGHHNDGVGWWFAPVNVDVPSAIAAISSSPIDARTTEYRQGRVGVESSLVKDFGDNRIEGGIWYEHIVFDQARNYYATSYAQPIISLYSFPDETPLATYWKYHYDTANVMGYVEDTYKPFAALTLSAGFKGISSITTARVVEGIDAYAKPSGTVDATRPFLPQAGADYALGAGSEIYADLAHNMRAFDIPASQADSPFATTQAGFNAIKSRLKPETSWTYEIGYRYTSPAFMAEFSVYHVDFSNRLLATVQGTGIAGNPSVLSNVGRVTTNGAELGANWRITPHLLWYNAPAYNVSRYADDYTSDGVLYATRGKSVVDSPKKTFKSKLTYSDYNFTGWIGANYMSRRYYTYLNDRQVPGRTLFDAGLSYRFDRIGPMHDVTFKFNVDNLLNKRYIATIGTNGFVASDPLGQFATMQVGAPRAFFGTIAASY